MKRLLMCFVSGLMMIGLELNIISLHAFADRTDSSTLQDTDKVIVKFKETPAKASMKKYTVSDQAVGTDNKVKVLEVPEDKEIDQFVKEMEKREDVLYAEPDFPVKLNYIPTDPDYTSQWHLKKIEAENAWNFTKGSSEIVVAIIDNGMDVDHMDLKQSVFKPYDMVYKTSNLTTKGSHGTHVAGIIAASMDNGSGGTGIAPGVKVMPINVFSGDIAYTSDIIDAIYYAVQNGAHIINMSLGGPDYSKSLEDAVRYAYESDLLIVAAAGNSSSDQKNYPAALPYVISVSSTDLNDRRSSLSNFGDEIDFAAPGQSIFSSLPNNNYGLNSGTSMASPLVAGVAALIWSDNPSLTNDQIYERLKSGAIDIGAPGKDKYFGYGRINAEKPLGYNVKVPPNTGVHYDWGWGSPGNGIPADYFRALFDQSGNYSGDYFVQTFADD
ncbi:S8 family peptidase, partial [Bacillus sp. V33-4]|uniref:S8 family peptidase n=1 Tax=Bacillus sp. V33-4 TaxID=2054169 RepID=UPI000CC27B7A